MNTLSLRRLANRPFVRNVAILSSGQAIAQGLVIAASPILTRLYDPDAFGAFGLLISLSAPLVGISALRYELAIVTAKDDSTAANLLALSGAIVLLFCCLVVALVGFAGVWIAELVDQPEFGQLLWWLPVLMIAGGGNQVLSYWTTRKTHYKRLAVSRVLQSLATLSTQLTAGMANLAAAGLVSARVMGGLVGAGILAIQIWRDDRSLMNTVITTSRMLETAKENLGFPKYNAPHNLINSLSKASVPYFLAPFFGVDVVGFYYLADRILNTPSALVSGSVRRVFFQRASELHNEGRGFYRLLLKTFGALTAIGIWPLIPLVFYGPEIFSFVFGAEWQEAGNMARWLAVWWVLAFISGPAGETLTILKLQKYLLIFRITFSTVRVLAIFLGAMIGDAMTAIAACSIVGAVFNLILIAGALFVARSPSALKSTEMD